MNSIERKFKRKYVFITMGDDGVLCNGIYENYYEAFGNMMDCIYELKEDYDEDGDVFEISDPVESEDGIFVGIKFQRKTWEKPHTEAYWLLFFDEKIKE